VIWQRTEDYKTAPNAGAFNAQRKENASNEKSKIAAFLEMPPKLGSNQLTRD
jgi:hypothetical protein